MKAGIVGFPQSGKTTIFKILTRAKVQTDTHKGRRAEPNVGVVRVPDERVDYLASVFQAKKTTYTTIEFVDIQGLIRGKGQDMAFAPVRDVDALVHVVRAFEDELLPHTDGSVNPDRDIRNFDAELILADLASVEKRLERLDKDLKKIKNQELERERDVLRVTLQWLESERPLREMDMDEGDRRRVRGFSFLSEKPMIYVLNLGDDKIETLESEHSEEQARPNTERAYICGKLEGEMAELPPEELTEFLSDYGIGESGMERLIRSTYHLLGLISFLTAGEEECRAWTIRRGTRAQQAAGAIHTDLEKHFIRAEVSGLEDFKKHPSFAALREHGLLRLEGKQYEVQDGDIITVRHGG
jgi:GTP-binding protein YchF